MQQAALQVLHLCQRHLALEHRFLNALPGAFTDPGDTAKAASAGAVFGVDVIADDDQYGVSPLFLNLDQRMANGT